MKELETSLLREKFIIHDPSSSNSKGPIIALSCRMVVDLVNSKNLKEETLIVRAQNMHSCVRMVGRIIQSYLSGGVLVGRPVAYDWDAAWKAILSDYETEFNSQRWIAIYHHGKPVFVKGDHHPFLDVIEKCAAEVKGEYEQCIPLAEKAFKQTGKVVRIEYDGNIALVVHLQARQGRCAIILRGAAQTATFNFAASARGTGFLNFTQILSGAAAFLEGIQLAFMVGMNNEKVKMGRIAKNSAEDKQNREGARRLMRLNAEIANLEGSCDIRYRPERPEFQRIMTDAEREAAKLFQPKGKK